MPAGYGTNHVGQGPCKLHGGTLPVVVAKAEKQRAAGLLATYGVARPGKADPRDVLSEELNRTLGHIDWLAEIIREMDPGALVYGEVSSKAGEAAGEGFWEVAQGASPSVWLQLYRAEREFGFKVAAKAADLGLMERKVEIEKAQAVMLARVLLAVTSQLPSLSLDDRNALPGLLRSELQALKVGEETVEAGVSEVQVAGVTDGAEREAEAEGGRAGEKDMPPTETPLPDAPLPRWSGETPQ